MKKVLNTKRRYGFKDVALYLMILAGHYIAFSLYIGFFLAIKYLEFDIPVDSNLYQNQYLFSYVAFIGPGISGVCHILYTERGMPHLRGLMWVHDAAIIIAVPLVEFI